MLLQPPHPETVNLQKRELMDLHRSLLRFIQVLLAARALPLLPFCSHRFVVYLFSIAIWWCERGCSHTKATWNRWGMVHSSPRSVIIGGRVPSSTHARVTSTLSPPFRCVNLLCCPLIFYIINLASSTLAKHVRIVSYTRTTTRSCLLQIFSIMPMLTYGMPTLLHMH